MLKVVNMKDFNRRGFGIMDIMTKTFISLDGKRPLVMTKKKAISCIGSRWLDRAAKVVI